MRHIKKFTTAALLGMALTLSPQQAQAQQPCLESNIVVSKIDGILGQLGKSFITAASNKLKNPTAVPVFDVQTQILIEAQTNMVKEYLKGIIETQTNICKNTFAVLNAIGHQGVNADSDLINLSAFANKAYINYLQLLGHSKVQGYQNTRTSSTSNPINKFASGLKNKAQTGLVAINSNYTDAPLQSKTVVKDQFGRTPNFNPNSGQNVQTQNPAGNNNFNFADGTGDEVAKAVDEVQVQFDEIGNQIDTVVGDAQKYIQEGYANVLGDLNGQLSEAFGGIFGDDAFGGIMNVFNEIRQNGILGAFKNLSGLGDIEKLVKDVIDQSKNIWSEFTAAFNNPMQYLGVPQPEQVLQDLMTLATDSFDQATQNFKDELASQTDKQQFVDNAYANVRKPGAKSGISGLTDGNWDKVLEKGGISMKDAAAQIRISAGGQMCLPGIDLRVKAKCEKAKAALQKLEMVDLSTNQAARSVVLMSRLKSFQREVILGDEASGECKDPKTDPECHTLIGMMARSINLRHDTQVQTAVQFTHLLTDLIRLEAAAWDTFTEGYKTVYSTSPASGS